MIKYLSVLLLSPALAFGQVKCIDTDAAFKQMREQFKEQPIVIAKLEGQSDKFITVWKTADGKTGSLTITSVSENKTCMIEPLEGVKIVGIGV